MIFNKLNPDNLKRIEIELENWWPVCVSELHERTNTPDISRGRMIVWTVANVAFNYSKTDIAKHYGYDRSTVQHGIKTVLKYVTDERYLAYERTSYYINKDITKYGLI